jgi:hypothetical protein
MHRRDTPLMTEESTTPDLAVLMQRVVDAVGARDIDAAVGFYASDAVFDMSEALGILEGRAAIRRFFEEWWSVYEYFAEDAGEIRDLGNGVVFVVFVQHARLPGSTGLVHFRFAAVTTWGNGLIEQQTNYTDLDEARAAAERLAKERG